MPKGSKNYGGNGTLCISHVTRWEKLGKCHCRQWRNVPAATNQNAPGLALSMENEAGCVFGYLCKLECLRSLPQAVAAGGVAGI